MITILDWRTADARIAREAVAVEAARWRADLAWDVGEAWRALEPARAAGTLPGWLAVDRTGRVAGWTCYLNHQGTLQIAAIAADSTVVTHALVDAVLRSPEAAAADIQAACVRDGAPGLADRLDAHGFDTVPYRYLCVSLDDGFRLAGTAGDLADGAAGPDSVSRAWRPADGAAFATLCQRGYAAGGDVRAFAPRGTAEEWRDYVAGLVAGPGCGWFVPEASAVIDAPAVRGLSAGLLATDLGLGTGHIAQIVVDPDARRRGLGAALLCEAIEAFRRRAFDRVTLLVSTRNAAAQRLYARFGFRDRGTFVVAQRRRSVSPAGVDDAHERRPGAIPS